MFDFMCVGKVFFFGSPCTLRDLDGAMTSRDMGTHGSPPTRVPELPVKWTWPVRSPTNLQLGLETLSTTPATLEDSRRPHLDLGGSAELVAQASPPGRGSTPLVGPQIVGFIL
jgi:hypothetical protein